MQGYGLTETCAASFLAGPFPGHSGTVGPPVPGTEYRLEGSSELGCALCPLFMHGRVSNAQHVPVAVSDR